MSPFNLQFCICPKLAPCTQVKIFHQITSSKEYLLLCFFFFFSLPLFFFPQAMSVTGKFSISCWHTHNGLALTTELNFLVRLARGQVSGGFSCGLGLQAFVGSVLVEARCICRSHKESVMKTSQCQSSWLESFLPPSMSFLVFISTNYSFWLASCCCKQLAQQTVAGEHWMLGQFF